MKRGIALIALFAESALADVFATADVNLRRGPGLEYGIVTSVKAGTGLEYHNECATDERGVDWYLVYDRNLWGWVSSRYSELDENRMIDLPVYHPDRQQIEISGYYREDLKQSAEALGLSNFMEIGSEIPFQYYDDTVLLGGYMNVVFIMLCDEGYTLCGGAVGMDIETASQRMMEKGLEFAKDTGDAMRLYYPAKDPSHSFNGYDAEVWLSYRDGIVYRIKWCICPA